MKHVSKLVTDCEKGFTLVEIVTVTAILGILTTIAVPNYMKYQAKARQSEAKIALSAIYTAETGFATETSTFTGCLSNIGYSTAGLSAGTAGRTYYATGFATIPATCGPAGATACTGYQFDTTGAPSQNCVAGVNVNYYAANSAMQGAAVAVPSSAAVITKTAFTASAEGKISNSTGAANDIWQINQNKNLQNTQNSL